MLNKSSQDCILEIKNLTISTSKKTIINDISLNIKQGKITTIVGESGSGKSVTSISIARLLDEKTFNINGEILFKKKNILTLNKKELRNIRKTDIAYIFQNPESALNPNLTIGYQISECITNTGLSNVEKKEKIIQNLRDVDIKLPEQRLNLYPFELSGGMQQRICIAMALISEKKFIIADEPTTALDVTTQKQILDIFKKLKHEHSLSILLITHNFGIVAEYSDYTYVMYDGKIVENGSTDEIIKNPKQEYTQKLLSSSITL